MSQRCRQSIFQRNILAVGMAVGPEEADTVPRTEARPVAGERDCRCHRSRSFKGGMSVDFS
jgi:hypothetical protein